jgi:DNA topoisomerase IB
MNIFDMAIEVTIRQGGEDKDVFENALKIRRFFDKNPKFVKTLFEDKLSLNDSEQRYLRMRTAKLRRG